HRHACKPDSWDHTSEQMPAPTPSARPTRALQTRVPSFSALHSSSFCPRNSSPLKPLCPRLYHRLLLVGAMRDDLAAHLPANRRCNALASSHGASTLTLISSNADLSWAS